MLLCDFMDGIVLQIDSHTGVGLGVRNATPSNVYEDNARRDNSKQLTFFGCWSFSLR